MSRRKGIILAGGKATRLYPVTKAVSKQLLPVYNKPMIYYPFSILLLAGIKDILIITSPDTLSQYQNLFGNGENLGIKVEYAVQHKPKGLADAFLVGEKFIGKDPVCLVLGDNIFYGGGLSKYLAEASQIKKGAAVFSFNVKDPQRYGIISFDKNDVPLKIEEKPKSPKSNWAVTGLYFYDNDVVGMAKSVKPSARGELEITDINSEYLKKGLLKVIKLGRGHAWLDTGTYDSLIDASMFIKTIEDRQGLKVGSVEEIAFNKGYISKEQLKNIAKGINTEYGDYLLKISEEK